MKDAFIEGIRQAAQNKESEAADEPTITTTKELLSAIKDSEEWQATNLAEEDERLFDIMMDPTKTQRERERAGHRRKLIHSAVFGDKEVSGSIEIPEIGGGWERPLGSEQNPQRGSGDTGFHFEQPKGPQGHPDWRRGRGGK